MRALAILAVSTIAAAAQPAPGRYCASGYADIAVGLQPGHLYVDLAECRGTTYADGRAVSRQCYGMGGASFSYDVDLVVLPGGGLLHDGVRYRRCP